MKHLNVRDLEQINLEKENIPVLELPLMGINQKRHRRIPKKEIKKLTQDLVNVIDGVYNIK